MTGSDAKESPNVQALRDLGASVFIGHDAANKVVPFPVIRP